MRKIVFFIATLCSGGAERVVSILSKELVDCGYEVEIVMYFDEPVFYKIDDRVKVVSVMQETNSRNILRNVIWMRHYFRKNASAVVSFLSSFNMLALVSTLFTRIPVIVSERTDPRRGSWIYKMIRDSMYHLSNYIVVQSKSSRDYFSKRLQSKMTVIYNPVDVKDYAGKAINASKEKAIVSVGRLIPVKNQKMMVHAFAEIKKRFPDYKLIIYGEGECREELQQMIHTMGMEDRVELPGNDKEVFRRLIHAELFMLTSDFEGMPNALLEAMCLGLPVISTKVSGATDVIQDGINGVLIEKNDTAQLVKAISSILSDDLLKKQYATKAAEVLEFVSVDSVIPKWIEIVEEIVKNA